VFGFSDITICFTANPSGKRPNLPIIVSEETVPLCQRFRRSLLDAQENFQDTIQLPKLPAVNLEWIGIGLTAAVAIWKVNGKIDAASILLNGLETDQDILAIKVLFEEKDWPLAASVWERIAREEPPVLVTVHYNAQSRANRTTATAAACLANTFFALFGTSGECCEPIPKC
jgi:hypothetical protein